jgi:interleukin-1 receptor-associated kinase 1
MFLEKTEQQQSQQRATNTVADQVVIAVKAEKVMSKAALAWALTHVVHPGDCITLIAVFTNEKSGNTDSQLLKNLLLLSTFLF